MRRNKLRHSEAPITLFSFQDIITTVTGIMILIVLFLILEMSNKVLKSTSPPASPVISVEVKALQTVLEERKTAYEKEKHWIDDNEKILGWICSTDFDKLPDLIKAEADAKAILTQSISMITNSSEGYMTKTSAVKAEIESQARILVKSEADINTLSQESDKALQLQLKQLEELKKRKSTVIFNAPRKENKEPILIECSNEYMKIRQKENTPPSIFSDTSNTTYALVRQFEEWIGTVDFKRNYVVLLIKPSAAGYATHLIAVMNDKKYDFYHEPLEEDKNVIE